MAGSPEVVGGSRTTLDVLQEGRKPDRAMDVADLEPNTVPLLQFTSKLAKKVAINPKYDWFEDEIAPLWVSVNGAIADGVTTSIVLDAGQGVYCPPGTLLHVVSTGEIMRVRSNTGDTIAVERGVGTTAGAAIGDDADLRLVGDGFAEGADAAPERSTVKTSHFNYTQIYKTSFGASGTQEASEMYWGNDRTRERNTRGTDHAIKIESSFFFGERAENTDPDTGKPYRLTGGVLERVTSLIDASGGAWTEAKMETFIERLFRYTSREGKQTKWLFCSRLLGSQINVFGKDRLETVVKEKTMGVMIQDYVTNMGRLLLITHNLFENSPVGTGSGTGFSGLGVGMDPGSPKYRFMKGRDTKLQRGIELPGSDTWKDQYMTEAGLELRQESWNGLITGVTA